MMAIALAADDLKQAIDEKNRARILRRSGKPDLQGAISHLQEAIRLIRGSVAIPTDGPLNIRQRDAARELADCYGSLGGTYRAMGDLEAAVRSYDVGFAYETDPRLGRANSYNLVNRLVVRLLMAPNLEQTVEAGTLRNALQEAKATVGRQTKGPRKDDMWAWGDHITLSLLTGDLAAARDSFDNFKELALTEHAYSTTRDVIAELSELDLPNRQSLVEGVEWFKQAIVGKVWEKVGH